MSSLSLEGKACPDCAEHVQEAAKVCRFCGFRFAPEDAELRAHDATVAGAPAPEQQKSTFIAGLFGLLLCGAGHLYARETVRGVSLFVAVVAVVAVAVGIGIGVGTTGDVARLLPLPLLIFSVIDARRAAENFNAGRPARGFGGGVALVAAIGAAALALGVVSSQTGAAIDTGAIESQIAPELKRQLQDQVPDATVSVGAVQCIAESGRHGTCIADVSDDVGNTRTVPIDFSVDASGSALWHTTN